jgi:CheY-like chemotaxis protein
MTFAFYDMTAALSPAGRLTAECPVNATASRPSADRECAELVCGLSVLVAANDADGAESMALNLERVGHVVRVVYDGQAAVAAALIDPPDAVILDVDLPRLDGWAAARRIRAGLGGRPCLIVAVSAAERPEDGAQSRGAGIQRYLTKPLAPGTLTAVLERDWRKKAG